MYSCLDIKERVNRAALMELCVIILFVESPCYEKKLSFITILTLATVRATF